MDGHGRICKKMKKRKEMARNEKDNKRKWKEIAWNERKWVGMKEIKGHVRGNERKWREWKGMPGQRWPLDKIDDLRMSRLHIKQIFIHEITPTKGSTSHPWRKSSNLQTSVESDQKPMRIAKNMKFMRNCVIGFESTMNRWWCCRSSRLYFVCLFFGAAGRADPLKFARAHIEFRTLLEVSIRYVQTVMVVETTGYEACLRRPHSPAPPLPRSNFT